MQVPEHYKLAFAAERINEQIRVMAKAITAWSKIVSESGHDVLAVPVLRGSIFFFADLMREVKSVVEVAPVRSKSYVVDANGMALPDVSLELFDIQPKGRSILLVDDICDSGRTLNLLCKSMEQNGAVEVKTAVLIRRVIPDAQHIPNYYAFGYQGPEWFVGYGMENKNRWSTLPDIYTLEGSGA